jgi:hypothetical protein
VRQGKRRVARWTIAAVVAIAGGTLLSQSVAQTAAQGRCGYAPGSPRPTGLTVDNPYDSMTWLVGRDSFCTSTINGVQDMRVTGAPHHGTLEVSGQRYTYRPEPGYVGPDEFTVGFMMHSYRTARGAVQVTLRVVP